MRKLLILIGLFFHLQYSLIAQCSTIDELLCQPWAIAALEDVEDRAGGGCSFMATYSVNAVIGNGQDIWRFNFFNVSSDYGYILYDCEGNYLQECINDGSCNPQPDIILMEWSIPVDWHCSDPLSECYPYEDLVITGLNYNFPASSDGLDFIEITNTSNEDINLNGVQVSQAVIHTFGNILLAPDESIVLVKNIDEAVSIYGSHSAFENTLWDEWTSGSLSDSGELILMRDPSGSTIDRVNYVYGLPWPYAEPGTAIILCNQTSNNDDGVNWELSHYDACLEISGMPILASPGVEEVCSTCSDHCGTSLQVSSIGDSCDDGDPLTSNDEFITDCLCQGTPQGEGDEYCEVPQDENIFGLEIGNRCGNIGSQVCVPVRVYNFENIVSTQFGIQWDNSQLSYISNSTVDQSPYYPLNNYSAQITENSINISWSNFEGVNLPDGFTIFELCFELIGVESTQSVNFVDLVGSGLPISIGNSDSQTLPFFMDCGRIQVRENCDFELKLNLGAVSGMAGDTILLPVIVDYWPTLIKEISIPLQYSSINYGVDNATNGIVNINPFLSSEGTWDIPSRECNADGTCTQPILYESGCVGCFSIEPGTKIFDLELIVQEPCNDSGTTTYIHPRYYTDSIFRLNYYAIDLFNTFFPIYSNMGTVTIEECQTDVTIIDFGTLDDVNVSQCLGDLYTCGTQNKRTSFTNGETVISYCALEPNTVPYNFRFRTEWINEFGGVVKDFYWPGSGELAIDDSASCYWSCNFTEDLEIGSYTIRYSVVDENFSNEIFLEEWDFTISQSQMSCNQPSDFTEEMLLNIYCNGNYQEPLLETHWNGTIYAVYDYSDGSDGFDIYDCNGILISQCTGTSSCSNGFDYSNLFFCNCDPDVDYVCEVENILCTPWLYEVINNHSCPSSEVCDGDNTPIVNYIHFTEQDSLFGITIDQCNNPGRLEVYTNSGIPVDVCDPVYIGGFFQGWDCQNNTAIQFDPFGSTIIHTYCIDDLPNCDEADNCLHPDYAGLMSLYSNTNGEQWTNNTGWGQDCEPCEWYGVECDENNRVVIIELIENNLVGVLPSELSQANRLNWLILRGNSIGGEVPQSYGQLNALVTFNLGDNNLTGDFPIILTECLNLKGLYLYGNNLNGTLPAEIGNLLQLEEFNVGLNNFSGTIPDEISNLLKLEVLNLRANIFNGDIPQWLGDLFRLRLLNLRGNNFTGGIPIELTGLENLEYLFLYDNGLTGPIPEGFGTLTFLETFRVEENSLSGCIPEDLLNLCNPNNDINIGSNPGLDNESWEDFCISNIGVCTIEEECPHPDYDALIALYVSTNGDQWTNSTGWGEDCEPCQWYGVECDDSNRVISLQLDDNNLSGQLPLILDLLAELKTIRVARNKIEGSCPPLGNLKNLEIFSVFGNRLTGSIPSLEGLSELRNFSCSYNQLSGALPDFQSLNKLENFACHNNLISGTLPDISQNLNLKRLFLNDNQIIGCYSDGIVNLCSWQHKKFYDSFFLSSDGDTLWYYWNDGYNFDRNPELPIEGDLSEFCLDNSQTGEGLSCNDGNSQTINDMIQESTCQCLGEVPVDCQPLSVSLVIDENQNPPDNNPSDLIICAGFTSSISSEVQFELYEWNGTGGFLSTEPQITVGGGSYNLTVTDTDGCTGSTSITIVEQPLVTHLLDIPTISYCNNSSQGNTIVDLQSFIEQSNADFHIWKEMDGTVIQSPAFYSVANLIPGSYVITLESYIDGCPPLVSNITIEVISCCESVEVTIDSSICEGMSLLVNGTAYSSTNLNGIEVVLDAVGFGCDSTYIVDLQLVEPIETILVEGCEGDEVEVNGTTYTLIVQSLQDAEQTLPSIQYPECDSTLYIQFDIRQGTELSIDTTLCIGSIMVIEDEVYTSEGQYEILSESLNSQGCDSLIILNIEESDVSYRIIDTLICDGQQVVIQGEVYDEIGSYQIPSNSVTQHGCDSIIRLNIDYHNINTGFLDLIECNVESVVVAGETFTPSDNQQDVLLPGESADGCDSLLMITVEFQYTGEICDLQIGEQGILNDECQCIEIPESCVYELEDDNYVVAVNEDYQFDILANDMIADSIQLSILSVSEEESISYQVEQEDLYVSVLLDFGADVEIVYEVCEQDCTNCAEATVTLVNEKIQNIVQTNVIIPDGDGVDDVLRFTEEPIVEDSELWIFNRDGAIIYHQENYDNSWDSTGLPGGIYFYLLKVRGVEIKKTLTVIK